MAKFLCHATVIVNYVSRKKPLQKKGIYSTQERRIKFDYIKTTYNPTHVYNSKKICNVLDNLHDDDMIKAFGGRKIIHSSRQPRSLTSLLIHSKFIQFINRLQIIMMMLVCSVVPRHANISHVYKWIYTRHFTSASKNLIYILLFATIVGNFILVRHKT